AQPKPRRTIMFIAFSGEEEGLLGSNYYVNHPIVPLTNTVAMINMDMIGRMKNKNLIIGGMGTAQEWRSMIDVANLLRSNRHREWRPGSGGLWIAEYFSAGSSLQCSNSCKQRCSNTIPTDSER